MHLFQKGLFAPLFEFLFQFVGDDVEMVLDGALAAAADEDELITADRDGLFHGVLDEGFIHHRHHFLGAGLGGWQEASTQSRHRKNRFANFWCHPHISSNSVGDLVVRRAKA